MIKNFAKLNKLLISAGLFIIAGVPIGERLAGTELPDAAKGLLIGFGIGLMIVALCVQKFKRPLR